MKFNKHLYSAINYYSDDLLKAYNYRCNLCGKKVYKKKDIIDSDYTKLYAVDHIKKWELKDESTHSVLNMRILCNSCNCKRR